MENHGSTQKNAPASGNSNLNAISRTHDEEGFTTVQGNRPRYFVAGSNTVSRINNELRVRNMYEPLLENIDGEQLAMLFAEDVDSAIRF